MNPTLFPLEGLSGDDVENLSILTASRTPDEANYLIAKAYTARDEYFEKRGDTHRSIDLRGKSQLDYDDHDALKWYSSCFYHRPFKGEDMIAQIEPYLSYLTTFKTLSDRRLTIIAPVTENFVNSETFNALLAQARALGIGFILEMTPECFRLGENKLQKIVSQCPVQLLSPQLGLWGFADLVPGDREDYTYTSPPKEQALKMTEEQRLWPRFKSLFA